MSPVVLPRSKHPISRRDIERDALKVLYRLHHAGQMAYLVGGAVRDLLVGRRPKDFDVSTDARPHRIKQLFRNCFLIGRRFRLAHIRFGPDRVIEVSTFRRPPTEAEWVEAEEAGTTPTENLYGTPEQDALRRDFTINGLFYDIADFSVIDYVGGLKDLEAGKVRSIGDPRIRFEEDPVRMIRAVRIAARLGFEIGSEEIRAIRELAALLQEVPVSRLLEEFLVLLRHGSAELSLRLLQELGLLEVILPRLAERVRRPRAATDLWQRIHRLDAAVEDRGSPLPDSLAVALLYSEPLLKKLEDPDCASHRSQAVRGVLKELVERLSFPKRKQERIQQVVVSQLRIRPTRSRRRRPMALVRRGYFPEALAFYVLVGDAAHDPANLARWLGMAREAELTPGELLLPELRRAMKQLPAERSGGSHRRRPRRRRDRGRRHKPSRAGRSGETPRD